MKHNEASKKHYRKNRYKRLAYQKEYNKINRTKIVEYQHDYFKKKQEISNYNKQVDEKDSIFTVTFL